MNVMVYVAHFMLHEHFLRLEFSETGWTNEHTTNPPLSIHSFPYKTCKERTKAAFCGYVNDT